MKLVYISFFISLFLLTSCGSSKNINKYKSKTVSTKSRTTTIVNDAQSYIGTRYRTGGTTRKGMDCSGLIYTAFNNNGVKMYRTSNDMSKQGKPIKTNDVKKGDLLFFKTSKSSRNINHVGLVTKVNSNGIYFIHSTTSKGVMESNLKTNYWNKAFKYAKRVL